MQKKKKIPNIPQRRESIAQHFQDESRAGLPRRTSRREVLFKEKRNSKMLEDNRGSRAGQSTEAAARGWGPGSDQGGLTL
jgi:hypothetical protein